ncbi:MAG: hypothetical protein AUJ12_03080 [Alphaproteobacteria bacterium CG1_02_46_17]|nr:MAG: hypothetical protein AUJ12_03080 [Alphaproteobacteria bacterium CG1_02_46_17]
MSEYESAYKNFMDAAGDLKNNVNPTCVDKQHVLDVAKTFMEVRDSKASPDPFDDSKIFDTIAVSETLKGLGIDLK